MITPTFVLSSRRPLLTKDWTEAVLNVAHELVAVKTKKVHVTTLTYGLLRHDGCPLIHPFVGRSRATRDFCLPLLADWKVRPTGQRVPRDRIPRLENQEEGVV